jgi:AcrR family transcriptional regulator
MFNEPIDFKEKMAETRRMQILMGAAQVFAQKGYHKATTKEIAQAAGVSEGTIYNYFENKRDILVAMVDAIGLQSVRQVMTEHAPDDPREFIKAVLRDRYQLAQNFGAQMAPIIAEMLTDAELRETVYQQLAIPLAGYVEKYIQANIDAGRFRPVDPVIATRAFVGVIFVNFALKLSNLETRYEQISPETLFDQLISFFLDGLLVK